MKNFLIAALAALSIGLVAGPALAESPVHLDLSAGVGTTSNLVKNQTNVSFEQARVSTSVKCVTLFGDFQENQMNRSKSDLVASRAFTSPTYDIGATLKLSSRTSVTVEGGTVVNLDLLSSRQRQTEKYVGVSATTRVF